MFKNSVIHKILSEFLQPFRYVGIIRVSPYLFVILIFIWVLGFWLVYSTTLLTFQKNTGLRVLVYPHFHFTRLLDGDPSLNTGLAVLVYPHFHLTRLLDGDPNDQFPLKVSSVSK